MKITLDVTGSPEQNAAEYYSKARKLREKADGARKALAITQKQIESEKNREKFEPEKANTNGTENEKPRIRIKRQAEWFERFRWFFTSNGLLAIGGRDASQNETAFKAHAEAGKDLFFHADVHGAPVVILKEGRAKAKEEDKRECAQFAVAYSSAWKNGFGSADAYCLPVENVSKSAKAGEYVSKGGFVMEGKREWFRNTELKLEIGIDERGRVRSQPAICRGEMKNKIVLVPGRREKGDIAKEMKKVIGADSIDGILLVLPAGKSETEK